MDNRNAAFTWFLGVWSAIMAFLAPIQMMLILIIVMITMDLVTGYISSLQKNKITGIIAKIRHFNSHKGTKSIIKMFFYLIFTIIVYLMEYALIGMESVYITKFSTFLIVFVELKSICENMDIITGRDVFTSLFNKIRKIFEKKISDQISYEEDNE